MKFARSGAGLACAALTLSMGLSVPALAQNAPPPEVLQAGNDWQKCLGEKLFTLVQTKATAEEVTGRALDQCRSEYDHAMAVAEKALGPDGLKIFPNLVKSYRTEIPRMVNQARSGKAATTPSEQYGQCLIAKVRADRANPAYSTDDLVNRAFAACKDQAARLLADLKTTGDPKPDVAFSISQDTLRKELVDLIHQMPAPGR
jgi:hypothetical protein